MREIKDHKGATSLHWTNGTAEKPKYNGSFFNLSPCDKPNIRYEGYSLICRGKSAQVS